MKYSITFSVSVKACESGNDMITYLSSVLLSPLQLLTIDDNFCGLDMNAPLGVSEMVRGIPLFSDANDKMTSVIAYVYKNHSLAFVGTEGGRLKKVRPPTSVPLWMNDHMYRV